MNAGTNEFFRETNNGIMQKIAPIYKKPDFTNGRAHFLSAEKVVAGLAIDTLVFNLGIIWLMSLVLYMALYFDWIRNVIKKIGRIKLKA